MHDPSDFPHNMHQICLHALKHETFRNIGAARQTRRTVSAVHLELTAAARYRRAELQLQVFSGLKTDLQPAAAAHVPDNLFVDRIAALRNQMRYHNAAHGNDGDLRRSRPHIDNHIACFLPHRDILTDCCRNRLLHKENIVGAVGRARNHIEIRTLLHFTDIRRRCYVEFIAAAQKTG